MIVFQVFLSLLYLTGAGSTCAKMICWPDIALMMGQRCKSWPSIWANIQFLQIWYYVNSHYCVTEITPDIFTTMLHEYDKTASQSVISRFGNMLLLSNVLKLFTYHSWHIVNYFVFISLFLYAALTWLIGDFCGCHYYPLYFKSDGYCIYE